MAGPDVRDRGDARARAFCEAIDLAGVVHAHLDDEDLRRGGGLEQRDGHANQVVEVTGGGVDLVLGAEGGGEHLLGGGLAHRTRHANDAPVLPRAPPLGKTEHELRAVVICGTDDGAARLECGSLDLRSNLARDGDDAGAGSDGVGDVVVSVNVLAGERDEQPALAHASGVDGDAGEGLLARAADKRGPGGRADVIRSAFDHAISPVGGYVMPWGRSGLSGPHS